jgi:beta-hydroxylase
VRHWEEGKSLVFDDTYVHDAWNKTQRTRVVLFMDILRPMRPPFSWLNEAVVAAIRHSPYVKDARRNMDNLMTR